LSARGQSVWIDYLSRDLLETGELKRMMEEDAVVGVTSNPTIFQKALSQGTAYDEQLKELEQEGDAKEIFLHLAVRDVEHAVGLLTLLLAGNADGGFPAVETVPTLAYDRTATSDEPIRVRECIGRPSLCGKSPRTEPGPQAIENFIAQNGSVNV